jgi:predicted ATP-dependent protease
LTGAQGVMIPRPNLRNLMLRPDVVEAVKTGKFRVYAVGTIDQGIEVLTGVPAGQRDREGRYPEGSVNDRVEQKLRQFTEQQKKIAAAVNQQYFGARID